MFLPEIPAVTFILGGLGSGKTELALNLAVLASQEPELVGIAAGCKSKGPVQKSSKPYLLNNPGEPIRANRRAHSDRPLGMPVLSEVEGGHANSLRMSKGGACPPLLSRYSKPKVKILDLDIINPFFRVRKVTVEMESHGIEVVSPPPRVANSDLPALPSKIWEALENPGECVICDIGGGELGLRPLKRLKESVTQSANRVYMVINTFRPGFFTVDQIEKRLHEYEEISGLSVTHLIANPNLGGETTPEVFAEGLQLIQEFSVRSNLPVAFGMAVKEVSEKLSDSIRIPILNVSRFWSEPWAIGLKKED